MKQKDIAIIIIIAAISGVLAYFAAGWLFGSGDSIKQEVETVKPITSDFSSVDKKYFNTESVNPAQPIEIGDTGNNDPFGQ